MGKLASTLSKALAAGAVAAAAGIVALGKAAITAYADYEQLVGGVETLFGKLGEDGKREGGVIPKEIQERLRRF